MRPDLLPHIQYRLSEGITLSHAIGVDDRNVTPGHKVKVVKGVRVEEVHFPASCPGLLMEQTTRQISVSFESGPPDDPDPTLTFPELVNALVPASRDASAYHKWEVSDDPNEATELRYGIQDGATVRYLGKEYQVSMDWHFFGTKENAAFLEVDTESAKVKSKAVRTVPGRRVGN